MSGVLVGEGAYGLRRIADTPYTPYWWAEAAVGLFLLAWVAVRRLEGPTATALAIVATAVTATAFASSTAWTSSPRCRGASNAAT